jgi:hypothetical protein
VYEQSPRLQALAGGADPTCERMDGDRKRLVEGLAASPLASRALRAHLGELHRKL